MVKEGRFYRSAPNEQLQQSLSGEALLLGLRILDALAPEVGRPGFELGFERPARAAKLALPLEH